MELPPDPKTDKPRLDVLGFYDTPLLTAEEEVTLAKRIEAGVYAGVILKSSDHTGGDKLQADPPPAAYADNHDIRADLAEVYKEVGCQKSTLGR